MNVDNGIIGNNTYQITELLGQGLRAFVYRGIRIADRTVVAIKVIPNIFDLDNDQRTECLREANNMRQCSNENIIGCFDVFLENNNLYLILEFAESGDMASVISQRRAENRPVPEVDIWLAIRAIASGLDYLASLRIMHRDIKPGNVLIRENTFKLADFGFSRQLGVNSMYPTSVVGSPVYMSPEIIQGRPYSFQSDIWSLGCFAYELATFQVPFSGDNYVDLANRITFDQIPPLDGYSNELNDIVQLMLSKDPEQRPSADQISGYSELVLNALNNPDRLEYGPAAAAQIRAFSEASSNQATLDLNIISSTIIRANPYDSYINLGLIGDGVNSQVIRARSIENDEIVAVKKVKIFDMSDADRQNAVTEASLLQRLPPHPNIIRYLRSYLHNNDLYLILEIADSGDLNKLLQERKRCRPPSYFTEGEIWNYFAQIADAVQVMHHHRILHRGTLDSLILMCSSQYFVVCSTMLSSSQS
jgi:NIMA (never in mitosis gene a)-related kinase